MLCDDTTEHPYFFDASSNGHGVQAFRIYLAEPCFLCVRACVRVCARVVRACVYACACVRERLCECECACVRVCVCACVSE